MKTRQLLIGEPIKQSKTLAALMGNGHFYKRESPLRYNRAVHLYRAPPK